jgi:hypothetical protein
MSESTQNKSADQIEAEIVAARERLADTVDELHHRTAPKEVARRQVESLKTKLVDATQTPDGQLRAERVAALVAAAVVMISLGLWRRRHG